MNLEPQSRPARPQYTHQHRSRILFVHHAEGLGGSARSLGLLVGTLSKEGFRCTVLMRHRDDSEDWFRSMGAEVVTYRYLYPVGFTIHDQPTLSARVFRPFRLLLSIPGVVYWYYRVRPHLVHLNEITVGYLCGVFKFLRCPVIIHRRIFFHPRTSLRWNINAFSIRRYATRVISIAESYKRQSITDRRNDMTIRNVVDNPISERDVKIVDPEYGVAPPTARNLSRDNDVILFVGSVGGNLQQLKGQGVFEEAMRLLQRTRPSVLGVVLGGDKLPEPIRRENVLYVGSVQDTQSYYSEAKIIAVPFILDHCARQIFEAYRSKVALICSDLPCLSEFVVDGETGMLVKAGDAKALAAIIEQLLDDDALRSRLAETGERYFLHLQQESRRRTIALFQSIAGRADDRTNGRLQ